MPLIFTPQPAGLAQLLNSPTGQIGVFTLKLGNEVAAVGRALAPRVTGELARSIRVYPIQLGVNPSAYVEANAPYALFVHEGTGPHPIDPVNARVLRFPAKSGFIVFTPHVDHPGTAAQPFLRDALVAVIGGL